MAVKCLREKCLFLPDCLPFGCGVCAEMPSHSRAPGNIWVRVRVSFTTGAVRSVILATAGLLVFIFTLMPLFSTLSFHLLNLLIRSSSVSSVTTKSSAYNISHSKATLNSLDKVSMAIANNKGLNAEPEDH